MIRTFHTDKLSAIMLSPEEEEEEEEEEEDAKKNCSSFVFVFLSKALWCHDFMSAFVIMLALQF